MRRPRIEDVGNVASDEMLKSGHRVLGAASSAGEASTARFFGFPQDDRAVLPGSRRQVQKYTAPADARKTIRLLRVGHFSAERRCTRFPTCPSGRGTRGIGWLLRTSG
ncbi:uncharacterized protein LOC125947652 [Dermacentor silvarum]|uniref:uncharacterized protein LOC125947652 n=1 Tax=Dermacentor silvarum TaxID=543639 RepID=UPI002101CD1C|nr:uncharacterized protein LOC125947652 [Dermacentor silvarum]